MNVRAPFAVLFALLLTGGNVGAAPFSNLYTFGDSLSDVGSSPSAVMSLYDTLANNCDPTHPCGPFGDYVEGRISNGPVATEYLAGSLFPGAASIANFHSYAVAGATSGVGNFGDGGSATKEGDLLPIPVPGIFPLPGMKGEVEKYMKGIGSTGGQADPNALFFVWGGANDYLTHDSPVLAARNIAGYVSELAGAGARHFLVPNLADLSSTPFVSTKGEAEKSNAQMFSLVFNEELASQLDGVSSQFPDANIFQFDTYTFVNGVIANPSDPHYQLTDVQNACLTSEPCANPGSFLYWDDFHPTTRGHSILGAAFASAVPEPEMLVMFVAGLFVLSIAGNRRRKLVHAV
ncbi:MAG: SGNH/GDSL hydrolase family protein [Nitrosospira sp.]